MQRVTAESLAGYADAGVTDAVGSLHSGGFQRNEDASEAFAAAML